MGQRMNGWLLLVRHQLSPKVESSIFLYGGMMKVIWSRPWSGKFSCVDVIFSTMHKYSYVFAIIILSHSSFANAMTSFDAHLLEKSAIKGDINSLNSPENSAQNGNATAQNSLGEYYFYKKNLPKSVYWLKKSADQGNYKGECNLGDDYEIGWGVPKNYSKSFYWFRKSADQGYARAEFSMGAAYMNGWGVPKNFDEAKIWLRKAADKGYTGVKLPESVRLYSNEGLHQASAIHDNSVGLMFYKEGFYPKAVYWFKKAADMGLADAESNLGVAYEHGRGVRLSYRKAKYWLKKSADQGSAMADDNLGLLYYHKDDYFRAVGWFSKGADEDFPEAEYNLGLAYLKGRGVPVNWGSAYYWLTKSASQGYAKASNAVVYMQNEAYNAAIQ